MILEDQIKAKMVYTDLSKYLNTTTLKFYRSAKRKDKLCELDHIWDQSPLDYSSNFLQQFYTLKYTYAYAFEYKEMYRKVLSDYFDEIHGAPLRIESIGCGNLVDGWSLFSVLLEMVAELGIDLNLIDYKGIDKIEWKNPLLTRDHFINIDAVKWFENKISLDSNVYMFPKSIGDFPEVEFKRILQTFRTKKVSSKILYVMVSLRKRVKISCTDLNRANELNDIIVKRGYRCKRIEWLKSYNHNSINQLDGTLSYPDGLKNLLKSMKQRSVCKEFSNQKNTCKQCNIDRSPMLYADNLCFLIMRYER